MSVRLSAPAPDAALPAIDTGALETRAHRILEALDCPDAELSISLVDDTTIAELNQTWRARPGPTDVLSFSLLEGEHAERRGDLLGDVVIGLEVAERQAGEAGLPLDEELLRLLIHGVLHLLGHDHQEPEETRRMQAEEARLREAAAS